jgi:riboflavin biosynthesis pyrimidine reductase
MVASADGRAARDGRAGGLGSDADTLMLTELRALADAVLLGTGTVRAEGYARLVAHPDRVARRRAAGLAETPLAVLISRRFDFPWDARLFTAEDQPVLLYAGAPDDVPAEVAAPVEVVPLDEPSPAAAMADLRARGVRALLCEGGPTLNRSLLAAGVVDELFLTISPLLTGDDEQLRIVQGAPLAAPSRLGLVWTLRHGDEIYLRYAVQHDG